MDGLAQDTDLIRRLVEFAGTTPAAVARHAGVAVTTVNRPYTGTSPSRLGRSALEKLQRAFPDFPDWSPDSLAEPSRSFSGAEPDRLLTADQRRLLGLFGRLSRKERAAVLQLLSVLAGEQP